MSRSGGTRRVLGFLRSYLRRRRRALGWLLAWSMAEAAPVYVLGRAVAGAVDAFLREDRAGGLTWLAVLLAAAIAGAVATRMMYRRLADVVEPLRDDLVRLVVGGALHRSLRDRAGALRADTGAVGRLTHQVEIVRDTFAGLLTVVCGFAFTAGAALLGLLTLAPAVLLFVVPPLIAGLALFAVLLGALARRQRECILADEHLAASASSAAEGLRDIVACGAEDRVSASAGVHVDEQAAATRALARLSAIRVVTLAVAGWLPVVLVLLGAPWLLRRGTSSGELLGALAYLVQGLRPAVHSLAGGIGGGVTRLVVVLGRILETSPEQASPGSRLRAGNGGPAPVGCGLSLRGVTFRYGANAMPVLDDLDLDIPEGDHLAVIGPSGIGKSTLAGVLTGMLTPCSGELRLGGTPLSSLPPETLMAVRTLIPQEAYVFTGTLRENLCYLRPGATDAALAEAAEAVGFAALVARLGGYAAEVDPASLSAGERQLIALGRAYLSAAPITVLDEAACHLDPAAEARAESAFAHREGTLVVIAHRISSALRARRVLIMDGRHVTLGPSELVLNQSPLYRELAGL